MATDRERFLAAVFTGPLLSGDAIVVLCGEDGLERAKTAVELFRQGAAPRIVCSGGRHAPPAVQGAEAVAQYILGQGVAPDRILLEDGSQHTREQMANLAALAATHGWKRVLLVASPYHVPRAMLTGIMALDGAAVRLVPVPCAHLAWWECPAGTTTTRFDLLSVETKKIDEYRYAGHTIGYAGGLKYLQSWEGK